MQAVRADARVTLILGGARSGKSRLAEQLASERKGDLAYIATGQAFDEEMRLRIAEHAARRGSRWRTFETPLDISIPSDCGAVLIDCLTLWLSNIMHAGRDVAAETAKLTAALQAATVPVLLVSNEVGLGIVPENRLARDFRDHQGRLNQAVATVADHVIFTAAGLPLVLK
jgi:adenosylcobinamide kinase / adenosylcobinamide-phosphate guanylyltransferase